MSRKTSGVSLKVTFLLIRSDVDFGLLSGLVNFNFLLNTGLASYYYSYFSLLIYELIIVFFRVSRSFARSPWVNHCSKYDLLPRLDLLSELKMIAYKNLTI